MSLVTFGAVLASQELAKLTGFTARQIPRKAEKNEIPNAERTPGGHWKFRVTKSLRGWICFYRVRHTLLRKRDRSLRELQILTHWGTKWEYAVEAYDFFKEFPNYGTADCEEFGEFQFGSQITWEAVEAIVLKIGLMPRRDWRAYGIPEQGSQTL